MRKVFWTPLKTLRNLLVIGVERVERGGHFSPSDKQDSREGLETGWSLSA
jgi:hypothetical protein